MTPRRIAIGIAILCWLHNVLRVVAIYLRAGSSYFNYLPPYRQNAAAIDYAPMAGMLVISPLLLAAVLYDWRRPSDERSKSLWASALWSGLGTVAVGLLIVLVSTTVERVYGWWLFVLLPVLTGIQAALLLGRRRNATMVESLGVSAMAVGLLGLALMMLAFEGAICLLMAAPLAIPLAMLGGAIGHALQRKPAAHHPVTFLLIAGLTPFGATVEHAFLPPADLFAVTTVMELRASPDRVWQTILQPSQLSAPSQLLFRAGVAYPLASHIEGAGPSATRYCDFSTGKLVEPVLIWDDLRQLRFTVASNPLPMQEWTPYARIHPPHLDGFLVSRQGEFRLTPLANGGTLLEATTWYQHHLWPAHYWRWWSDYIIHQVHGMVLENIRQRAGA